MKDEIKEKEIINKLIPLLEESVKKNFPKEKFGLLLGGLDSSILALILKKLGYDFICYVVEVSNANFKKSEDIVYAKKLAEDLNLKLKIVQIGNDKILDALKIVSNLIKDTFHMIIALPLYFGFKEAQKDGCKSIFAGIGSDAIFAGFEKHKQAKDLDKECLLSLKKCREKLIIREEVLAKHCNLKLIVPFLDKELVDYSMKISGKYKIKEGVEKYILREAALKLGLPEYMATRKKKAIQYSSNCQKSLKKIAKRNGFVKIKDYLETL